MSNSSSEPQRSVLITGSSSGIGEACVLALHSEGWRIFAGVRREDDGQRLVQQTSERVEPVLLDVTDPEAIQDTAQRLKAKIGESGLAGLVNNAGVTVAFPLEFLPIEELRRQFEVNVLGPAAVTQALMPMVRAAQGRIVNVSSASGLVAAPYIGPYTASKHALEAMTDALRMEVAKFGVSVSLIEPADVDTPIWRKSRAAAEELRNQLLDQYLASVSEEVRAAYAKDIDAMRLATEKIAANAMPTRRVVKAVSHALTARRPKTRYAVGAKTWAVRLFVRHLPDRIRDLVIRRSMGMK